jgi:hypothetical protein
MGPPWAVAASMTRKRRRSLCGRTIAFPLDHRGKLFRLQESTYRFGGHAVEQSGHAMAGEELQPDGSQVRHLRHNSRLVHSRDVCRAVV